MATTLAKISIKDSSSWNTYLNLIYPVGSYYISNSSTSPATRFGGTWTQITGRVLYCNSSVGNYDAGTHTHGLSNGAAMIDYMLGSGGSALVFFKTNSTYRWNTSGVPLPGSGRYIAGTAGVPGEDPTGNYLTKLYGNSNSATNGLPARRDVYCWYRTA